jgi:hypothetical protein
MSARANARGLAAVVLLAALAGCATAPPPLLTLQEQYEPESVVAPSPLIEYPPIEPVEPPLPDVASTPGPPASATSGAARANDPPKAVVALATPSPPPAAPPPAVVETPSEDAQLIALLGDLQRYGGMANDDLRRELAAANAQLARQRTDANRVRLAVLYTLTRANPQDDQRAQQLLENVAKSPSGTVAVKQLAAVILLQIVERQRAVRDEQQKADAAIQKLEALRQVERILLRDRVRSGGGGDGGGGSGGGSGGGK